jgi:hypothetical protein
LIEGRSVLFADLNDESKYKTEGLELNPGVTNNEEKLRIHVIRDFQHACENNTPRLEALQNADRQIRGIVSGLEDNSVVLVFSGCGDIHTFKKFEQLAAICEDETQRLDVEKALQRAKDKAVSAFAIISAVSDFPVSLRTGCQNAPGST